MKTALLAALAAAFFFSALPALADEYVILDQRAEEFDRWDSPFEDRSGPITIISRETGLPETVLVEQHSRTNLGYGGLLIANSLATETGRSFDEIVALKESGHGWGWIAQQNSVKLGPIVSRVHRADGAFRETNRGRGNINTERAESRIKTNRGQTKVKVKSGKGNGTGKIKGNGKGRGQGGGKGQGGGHGKGGGGKGKGR